MNNRKQTKHGTQRPAEPRLGIDIGRVLMCPAEADGRPDTSFLHLPDDEAVSIPPAPFMVEVVSELVQRFGGRVWLVSKAGPRIERLTRLWLDHQGVFGKTGMAAGNVRFCRRREDKRIHASELRLTHFIDDRVDVLTHLHGLVPHLYLFGVQTQATPPWATHAADWLAVRELLVERSLGAGPAP